jgi:Flp pilus assembly protein TadD
LGCSSARGFESAEAIFQRAAASLKAEDYRSAERDFRSVLTLEPRNVGAMGNLGVVYPRTRRFSQAIDIYRQALRIAPRDKFLATNLGLAYVRQEQYTSAPPIFEKLAADRPLLAAEPGNAGALSMLGVALTRLNRTEEAHAAFARMMDAVSPAQAKFLMGKASYETERFAEAADFFRQALSLDPALDGAHRELGKTLISLRAEESAEKELRQAAPDDSEALYFLGAQLARTRAGEAIPVLERARDLAPDLWGPSYYLGRIYLDQSRLREALPLLERAARLNPDEPAIQYQLGRALQKAGRAAGAQAAFARMSELKQSGRGARRPPD